jgi:hypothetical protein
MGKERRSDGTSQREQENRGRGRTVSSEPLSLGHRFVVSHGCLYRPWHLVFRALTRSELCHVRLRNQ